MADTGFILTVDDAKKYAADTGAIAKAVESLLGSDGWKIFSALFIHKKREIMARDDYETLDAFKGDRKAIDIVEEILTDLKGYIEDAKGAQAILNKLAEEDQTSSFILSEQQGEETREG